eukprot:gene22412-28536_t
MKKDIKTHQGVICWGNSNLNPDFYKDVLRTCAKYQRVVRFVRWGKELPSVPLRELFKRNILQYLKTGRYTESTKIVKFRKYAEFFTTKAGNNTHKDYAALAGYNMDTFGCVTEDTPANRKSSKTHSAHSDVTQWSAWTNTGQVFNVNHGTPAAVAIHSAPPSPSLSIPPPVVIPPSPRSNHFASTNTSAAKTPAHGDVSKHFFAADSDHSLLSSGDQSANGTKGIAELMSDIPEVSESSFSRPPALDISKSQSVSPTAVSIPPLGKTSPRERASSNAPSSAHSSPRNSRSGSYTGEKVSPKKQGGSDETNAARPALTPAASVAGAFMHLFSASHESAATTAPSASVSASASTSASGKHVDFAQPAAVPESAHHTSHDERETAKNAHVENAPVASTASPEGRKKSMIESLFSHVEAKDDHATHTEVAPVSVVAAHSSPPPAVHNARQSSILSLFQHVEDPVVEEEEKEKKKPVVVVQAPAARQSSILSLFQHVEDEPVEESIAVSNEEAESNAAVFILDTSNAPHVYEHQHGEDHKDLHVSADEDDEEDDDEKSEGSQPDEMGFSKPEPLVHDHHKVFLQDSVKLAHQHPHTHKDDDTHNKPPARDSPKPSISFKEFVEEIPVSSTNSSSMPTQHRSEGSTNEFAPAPTQRKTQDPNPFSCILPAIFCGM